MQKLQKNQKMTRELNRKINLTRKINLNQNKKTDSFVVNTLCIILSMFIIAWPYH